MISNYYIHVYISSYQLLNKDNRTRIRAAYNCTCCEIVKNCTDSCTNTPTRISNDRLV